MMMPSPRMSMNRVTKMKIIPAWRERRPNAISFPGGRDAPISRPGGERAKPSVCHDCRPSPAVGASGAAGRGADDSSLTIEMLAHP